MTDHAADMTRDERMARAAAAADRTLASLDHGDVHETPTAPTQRRESWAQKLTNRVKASNIGDPVGKKHDKHDPQARSPEQQHGGLHDDHHHDDHHIHDDHEHTHTHDALDDMHLEGEPGHRTLPANGPGNTVPTGATPIGAVGGSGPTQRRTSWTQDISRKAQNLFRPGAHKDVQ